MISSILDLLSGIVQSILNVLRAAKGIIYRIGEFFSKVWDFVSDIPDFFTKAAKWFYDFLFDLPFILFDFVVSGLVDFITTIMPTGLLSQIAGISGHISSGVQFWLAPFNVGFGFGSIMTAYIARFLLRRIPFIGG